MTIPEPLQALLTTAKSLATDALTTAGIPASYAPLALILGGLAGIVMLLSMAGGGSTREVLRPSPPTTRGSGAPTPRSVHPLGREGHYGGGDTTTPRAGGARRKGGGVVEQAGGKEPLPRRWLLPDLVPYGPLPRWRFAFRWPFVRREVRGYVTAMVGMAGTKKSYLLLDFGTAAVTGGEWAGRTVQRVRRVLYVDCELDAETFKRRAFEVARGRGLKKPPRGLHYLELTGTSLASAEGWERVDEARRRCRADAILVDSISIGAFTVTTNDAGAMNRLFGSFEAWGVPVFAIDHLGKDPSKGAVGSFMKYAKIRSELTLRAVNRGLIQVAHSKTNFGAQLDPFQVVSSFVGGTSKDDPLAVSFTAALLANAMPTPTPQTLPVGQAGEGVIVKDPAATVEQPAPQVTHHSPIIAWLAGQPDTTAFVPSRAIYDAGLLPERACKVQLKALWEAGKLQREGTANAGYLYRLPGTVAPAPPGARRSKYGAVRTEWAGVVWDSKGEALYAQHLDTLKAAGQVVDWRRGRPWVLQDADPAKDVPEVTYRPDFETLDASGNVFEVIDFKGVETALFKAKAKLFRARHSTPLRVVTKADLPQAVPAPP